MISTEEEVTVSTTEQDAAKYHIQPYHMNGLNWRLVPDDPDRDNIVIVTGFMPSWWTEEYGITFGADFHLDLDVHRATLARIDQRATPKRNHTGSAS